MAQFEVCLYLCCDVVLVYSSNAKLQKYIDSLYVCAWDNALFGFEENAETYSQMAYCQSKCPL